MNTAAVDTAIPTAYISGRPRPRAVAPGHQRVGGVLRHVSNTAAYDGRTYALVTRDGWNFGSVKGAIVWALYRAAIAGPDLAANLDAHAHMLDDLELHPFEPSTLTVDGVARPALRLCRFGVTVRAADVDGWTVLVCTPGTQDADVETTAAL